MSEGMDVPEGGNRTLNRMVATTVVALSVVMAVGKIKDDNIVQAMQADQAAKIDLWNEYQATKIKAHDLQIQATMLTRLAPGAPEIKAAAADTRRYEAEAHGLRAQAEAAASEVTYPDVSVSPPRICECRRACQRLAWPSRRSVVSSFRW